MDEWSRSLLLVAVGEEGIVREGVPSLAACKAVIPATHHERRRSGEPRSVIVGDYEDGAHLVTMAMNGWGAAEPAWWLNLQADPHAVVEIKDETRREVLGRAAKGEERARLRQRWREIDRKLDEWAARRPRETAVVILEPSVDADAKEVV